MASEVTSKVGSCGTVIDQKNSKKGIPSASEYMRKAVASQFSSEAQGKPIPKKIEKRVSHEEYTNAASDIESST